MAGTLVDIGTGTTVGFGTSAWAFNLLGLSLDDIAREALETSHMGTAAPGASTFGNRTFIPGDLSDPGTLEVTGHFNPDTLPIIDAVAETITVTFPLFAGDATAAAWEFSGFMTNFSLTDELETVMEFTAEIKITGNVTLTPAA